MFVILTPFITACSTPPPTCPRPTVVTAYGDFINGVLTFSKSYRPLSAVNLLIEILYFDLLYYYCSWVFETPSVIHQRMNHMTQYSQSWLIDYSDDLLFNIIYS